MNHELSRKEDAKNPEDLSEVFYSALRDEMMKRLELREHTLTLSAVVLAALLGYGLTTQEFKTYLLIIMGALSLGSTILVGQHSSMIGFIAEYLDKECRRYCDRSRRERWQPWETSDELRRARDAEYRSRALGEGLILLLPLGIGLFLALPEKWDFRSSQVIIWFVACSMAMLVLALVIHHFRWHSGLHQYSRFFDPSVNNR